MLAIGEFSRITELTIKTLRYYHELGILIPDQVDQESGYRYYSEKALEAARRIKLLKDLGFSLNEIKSILAECKDEDELQTFIHKKLTEVEHKIKEFQTIKEQLLFFRQNKTVHKEMEHFEIVSKIVPDKLICSIRFQGSYSQFDEHFAGLFKHVAHLICNAPFALYHDLEYKEGDALLEACVEVKRAVELQALDCRVLKGGEAVALLHKGPYGTQGSSYQQLFTYCKQNNLPITAPICETFIKGPGLIFKGNPQKYLTELLLFLK